MQKIYILFQTTELSDKGHQIFISQNNDMSDVESYFNKIDKCSSWGGLSLKEDRLCFVKDAKQEETNRNSKNILLIINKNIKKLNSTQLNIILEKAKLFFERTYPELKEQTKNKDKHINNSIVAWSEITKLEEELLEEIPELKNDFIESSKKQLSFLLKFFRRDTNKKTNCLVILLIISLIANIFFWLPRKELLKQSETKPIVIAKSDEKPLIPPKTKEEKEIKEKKEPEKTKEQEITKTVNDSKITKESDETKKVNSNNTSLITSKDEVIKINNKPREKQEEKKVEEPKEINKFEFIDEIAKNYDISKDELIKLVNEKTNWKDLRTLVDNDINQLKDYLYSPENIIFIALDDDKKTYLKKFLSIGRSKLNKEYVLKCKNYFSSFVKSFYELSKNKNIIEKYTELYHSFYPKERLNFVCHLINARQKYNNEEKGYSYIFSDNDYKNVKFFESIFLGKESIAEKFLKNTVMSELTLKTNIINCNNIDEFLNIYNSKLKNIINKKLPLTGLENKLVDDFGNWSQEMKNDYNKFQESVYNSDSDVKLNDVIKKFVQKLITDKINSDDFKKELQNVNVLYEKLINDIERMEEIK